MQEVRRAEQRAAAVVGGYGFMAQLDYPSRAVKDPAGRALAEDLAAVVARCRPQVVYTHNPADKHDTHIGVLVATLEALRSLPREARPRKFYGCEVWRDLDWMVDADKQVLDAGRFPNLALALVGVFDSQISGGKRYDLATAGRRVAHATYHTSHATDQFQGITWAMDLTPLVNDPSLSLADYTLGYVERLKQDITARLAKFA
jgi:LmbE family N-acetylglucosaminyl deacetylase